MFLSVRNVGKVESADIEIKGITVIAGENNTGKSTIGEVLFCFFNSFHNPEARVRQERVSSISRVLSRIEDYRATPSDDFLFFNWSTNELARQIVDANEGDKASKSLIAASIRDSLAKVLSNDYVFSSDQDDAIQNAAARVKELLSVSDDELFRAVLARSFRNEFSNQVNNIYASSPALVELTIKDASSRVEIVDNAVCAIEGILRLRTEAVYLDDPFVLDSSYYFAPRTRDHRAHLRVRLEHGDSQESGAEINRIVTSERLSAIYGVLDGVCEGRLVDVKDRRGLRYAMPGTDKLLDARNLSSGLKTFAIIKHLLMNGTIEDRGTVILDEPEIHLHPEWQIVFAELIVMLQKEFDLHILLNTHSPYFLNAIQVYSQKHGVADACRYYQAVSNGCSSCIEDVSDNVEKIYEKLAAPFQLLEDVAYAE